MGNGKMEMSWILVSNERWRQVNEREVNEG